MIVETEKENESWKDIISSQERRGEVVRKMCDNLVLRIHLKQSLSDACSTGQHVSRATLLDMLGHRTFLSWNCMVGGVDVAKKKMEIEAGQERLIQKEMNRDKGDMSWWRSCLDVRLMWVKSGNGEEGEGMSLEDDDHWKAQQKFKEVNNDVENRISERLELFRNEIILRMHY